MRREDIKSTVKRLGEQRTAKRNSYFSKAHEQHGEFSRRSGAYMFGRTATGELKETRRAPALRIDVKGWHATIGFKRDNAQKLKHLSWGEVEAALKQGAVPHKAVQISTHIITAVRALNHVRLRYSVELDSKDLFLKSLDEANVKIVHNLSATSDEDIDNLLEKLRTVEDWLKKKRSAIHRIVGMGRLKETIRRFEEAKSIPIEKRAPDLARACAVFTSLRTRIGQWRDREIAYKMEYNHQRECALRVERDAWLFSQLAKFSRIPRQMHDYVVQDNEKKEKLQKVRELLEAGETENAMKFLWLNWKLFTGSETKPGYLVGDYGWIHRYVKRGEIDKALQKIDHFILWLDSNKPRFIFDELSKESDLYLQPVLTELQLAIEAFEKQDFKSAQRYFSKAASEMRQWVIS
ncbi:hypothetical protein KKB44_03995 [Candidatus Micrarchaeota archaeon]|nr:hypothetical protein [Candidatus Micrarchaeota archaeon]